jgi:hypothetical protein
VSTQLRLDGCVTPLSVRQFVIARLAGLALRQQIRQAQRDAKNARNASYKRRKRIARRQEEQACLFHEAEA